MQPYIGKKPHGPEHYVRDAIVKELRYREWLVKMTHGNQYQSGFPDLFCAHKKYGIRWVEVKLPEMKGSHFTAAQLEWFPQFSAAGVGIWVLTGATDHEIGKLHHPANWTTYLKW